MMPRQLIGLALVTLVSGIVLAARVGGGAAAETPTPTAAATSTPPATPLPAGTLRILVFNDVNSNGLPDTGEPGLENWRITGGCSDGIRPFTTDANGEVTTGLSGTDDCYSLTRQFGWLPTFNDLSVRIPPDRKTGYTLIFGLHDFGRTVMELRGESITGGLPSIQGALGVEEPFRSCGHLFFESVRPIGTYAGVIVEGADTRAGCPHPGDNVAPSSNGVPPTPGPALPFAPGTTAATSWVSNGDSMRFIDVDITDASVFDVAAGRLTQHCAVTREVNGFVRAGSVRVFVLSDRARPGCGAPGRMVRLFRDGLPLAPDVEWRAGDVSQTLPQFDLAPPADTRITPPETGSAGLLDAHGQRARPSVWPILCTTIVIAVFAMRLRTLARHD